MPDKLVIGYVGEALAGKETVIGLINEWAGKNGFTTGHVRSSGFLTDTIKQLQQVIYGGKIGLIGKPLREKLEAILRLWLIETNESNIRRSCLALLFEPNSFGDPPPEKLEINRENLQKLPVIMERAFGDGTTARVLKFYIEQCAADVVHFDALRLANDETVLRSFPNNVMLYVTANLDTRYERLKTRRRQGEEATSKEDFVKQCQAPTEILISKIGKRCDYRIDNNWQKLEPLQCEVEKFCDSILAKIRR